MQTALEIGLAQHDDRVKKAADAGASTRYTAPKCGAKTPKDCRCSKHAHSSNPRMSEGTARAGFGYTYNKRTGALNLTPWKPSKAKTSDRMLENVAACESLGLSYWSDAPDPNRMWAVDHNQTAHLVLINRKTGKAWHECSYAYTHRDTSEKNFGAPIVESKVQCNTFIREATFNAGASLTLMLAEAIHEEPAKPLYVNPGPTIPDTQPNRWEPKGPPPLGHQTAAEKRALKARIEERKAAADKEMDEYAAAYAIWLKGEGPKPVRPSERDAREAVAKGRNPFLGKASDVLVTKIGAEGQVESDAKLASAILTTFATGEPPEPEMEGAVANMVEGMSVEAAWELFVHDPTYFDDFNDDMLERLRKKAGRSGSYFLLIRDEIKRRSDARG